MYLALFTVTFVVCSQVYNEQIRDLLANAGPLAVREDSSKGVVVQGLTLHQVSSSMYPTHHPIASCLENIVCRSCTRINAKKLCPLQVLIFKNTPPV